MTLELVPWRGTTVPVLARDEIARYSTQDYINWLTSGYGYMGPPMPVTTYGTRPAEPIGNSFLGFVQGMLYADTPVAAAEAYRLRVFGQAPLLYQELVDGRAGDLFDDKNLDRIREPWPGATLSDLMKRALIYGDFAGNAFIVDLEDELVLLRPDWVQIILEKRMHRGQHLGYKQVGIMYYEGGYGSGDGVPFLPGEYCHFVPGLPDPLASYRGMSWLTPLIREVQADKAAHEHKLAYFENSASVNLAVSLPKEITPSQFEAFVELMDAKHKGVQNAGKTLYTGGGADVTVIGNSMQQADFASIIGKGETRVANMAGVPPVLLSFSEGMQGSSLNAGNYTAAKRNFVDTTMRDLWQNFSGSVSQMDYFRPPLPQSRLWYDGRDIPFLHEDAKDTADIQSTRGSTINNYIREGWEPESAKAAVLQDDVSLLKHSGALSVQLQAPGAQMDLDQDGAPDDLANLDFGALRARFPFSRISLVWPNEEIERRDYLRHDKGTVGGGRFRRLSDISTALLKDWADNKGDGDPLARFNRDQLRRISKDFAADARSRGDNDRAARLTPRRGASAEEIKLALYADANGGEVDLPEATQGREAPAAPQPVRELSYEDALEAGDREAAIDAAHVEMREKLGRALDDDEADRLDRNVDAAIKRREKKNPTPPAQAPSVTPEPAPEPDVVDGGAFDEPDDDPTPQSQGLDVTAEPAAPSADFAERDRSAARGVDDVLASAPTLVTYDEEADEVTVSGVPERDRKRIAQSVVTYQDVGWDVNSYLRHGAEAYGPGGRKKLTAAKVKRTIDDLDILFEASRLDRPVEVWRGFGGRSTFGGDPDLWPDDLTGREFTDAGYVSTAADHAEATRYASQGSAGPSDERGVTARIILPEGAPVLALGAGFAESSEMLLSRGWTFRVVADHGWQDERRGQRTVRNRLVDLEAIPPADAGFAAMRADLWEFDDDEIERAFNTAQLRHAAGTSLGGEWRRMSDYAAALLKKWARGDGPDDPLGEDDFSETQLRTILKDFRDAAAANGDSVRVARLTPPRAGRGDSPAVKLNRLKAVLYEDVRTSIRDQRGEPKPSAKFTLQGPAHRDMDVAVYKDKDGKPALRKENDRGEPGAVVARFDSLQELAQWADDNGEPRLGDWARAEGGQKAPAVKRVPAKKAPAPKASVRDDGLMDEYEEALHGLTAAQVRQVAEEMNIPAPVGHNMAKGLSPGRWPASKDARIRYMLTSIDDARRRMGARAFGRHDIPRIIESLGLTPGAKKDRAPRTIDELLAQAEQAASATPAKRVPRVAFDANETADRLRQVGTESEAIKLLAGDSSLTPTKLRKVADALGIDVPADMRAKSSLQMHIAEQIGKRPSSPDLEGRGPEGLSTGASLQGRTERELRAIAEAEGIPLPSRGSREQLAAIIANMRSRRDNPGANVFADPDSPAGQGFATTTPIKPTRPVRPSGPAEELASLSSAQLRELAAAEGIPLPRTGSARELAEVIVNVRNRRDNPGANVFADPTDTAAARQSDITSARGVADLLSTLDEQADNEASPDLLLSRLRAARDKGVSGGVVDRLEAVVGRDRAELDRVRADIAAEHGLTPTTSAGAVVPFDRTLHQIIDGRAPRKGSLVHVVRPGYELDRDGERIPLGRAVVEVATAEELRPPYLGPDNSVDLERFGEVVGADFRPFLDPTRNNLPLVNAPMKEQFPFSYELYLISDRLAMGKISTKKAIAELREQADRADLQVRARQADLDRAKRDLGRTDDEIQRWMRRDLATVDQGQRLAPILRRMADELEATKIPPRKRGVTLSPTEPGVAVPVDESRFRAGRIKGDGGLIVHRGEAVPDTLRHSRRVRLASVAGQQVRPGLTAEESQALDRYTAVAVADKLNASLRQGKSAHGVAKIEGIGEIDLDEVATGLDAAIENSQIAEDAVLWRGALVRTADLRRLTSGTLYRDAGYLSTTTDEGVAHRTIRRRAETAGTSKKPVVFKLLTPSGTPAALGHEDVSEAVLGRGQQFRVIRVDDSGDVPVVVMEALPRGGSDPTYTPGRTVIGSFDFAGAAKLGGGSRFRRDEGVGDEMLAAIQKAQGYDGPARVVDAKAIDGMVAGGAVELFRGYRDTPTGTAASFAEDFRSGPLFPGLGTYGDGTYAGTRRTTAETYGTAVARMALRRDARVIGIEDLRKLHEKATTAAGSAIDKAEREALALVDRTDPDAVAAVRRQFDEQRKRLSPRARVIADMGRYAALLGYDAIRIPAGYDKQKGAGNAEEYVILNRTAVFVEAAP